MYVLGLNLSHDASACLLEDGRVVAAIAEERLNGMKRSSIRSAVRKPGLSRRVPPLRAIDYCLQVAGIGIDDLSLVVADNAVDPVNVPSLAGQLPVRDKTKIRALPHPSHHLAHAYSAYACSTFEECAVLVADTFGSSVGGGTEAETGFAARDGEIKPVLKNIQRLLSASDPHAPTHYGLTYLYNFVSLALGFGPKGSGKTAQLVSEAGKTMGLSAYGRPHPGEEPPVRVAGDRIQTHHFTRWALDMGIGKVHKDELVPVPRRAQEPLTQLHMDLAATIQAELEKGLVFLAKRLFELTGSRNLCIAGGAGLNSVANKRILDETPFEQVFIQPASTDDGIALGCALYGWMEYEKGARPAGLRNVYLGRTYDRHEVQEALVAHGLDHEPAGEAEVLARTAQALSDGKIVGWFQGGAEFGPRALGHRSILADARRPDMKDVINRKVKHREDFRPYAPTVLLEHAQDYFDLSGESPYMLLVADVHEGKRDEIPAVVHVDGTARVQTVTRDDNGVYYELVRAFHALTGVPVILNTSFNVRGMPIVETPDDALRMFFDEPIDVLVLGAHVLDKAEADTLAAQVRYLTGHDKVREALKLARRARGIHPKDGRFHAVIAAHEFERQTFDKALKAGERAISLGVDPAADGIARIIGISLQRLGEHDKAIPWLRRAEAALRDDESINFALGACYKALDQPAESKREVDAGFDKLMARQRGF